MKGLLSAALLLSLFSSQSYALTSQEFYDRCNNLHQAPDKETTKDALKRAISVGSCSGFVGGVITGFNVIGYKLKQQGAVKHNLVCLPAGKQTQELLNEVITYIQENPKLASQPVQFSIYNKFLSSYSCGEVASKPPAQQ